MTVHGHLSASVLLGQTLKPNFVIIRRTKRNLHRVTQRTQARQVISDFAVNRERSGRTRRSWLKGLSVFLPIIVAKPRSMFTASGIHHAADF